MPCCNLENSLTAVDRCVNSFKNRTKGFQENKEKMSQMDTKTDMLLIHVSGLVQF